MNKEANRNRFLQKNKQRLQQNAQEQDRLKQMENWRETRIMSSLAHTLETHYFPFSHNESEIKEEGIKALLTCVARIGADKGISAETLSLQLTGYMHSEEEQISAVKSQKIDGGFADIVGIMRKAPELAELKASADGEELPSLVYPEHWQRAKNNLKEPEEKFFEFLTPDQAAMLRKAVNGSGNFSGEALKEQFCMRVRALAQATRAAEPEAPKSNLVDLHGNQVVVEDATLVDTKKLAAEAQALLDKAAKDLYGELEWAESVLLDLAGENEADTGPQSLPGMAARLKDLRVKIEETQKRENAGNS